MIEQNSDSIAHQFSSTKELISNSNIITNKSSNNNNNNNNNSVNLLNVDVELGSRAAKKSKKRERSPTVETTASTTNQQQQLINVTSQPPTIPASLSSCIKKEKQKPETWNKIEQQIFFNALRQNGKNFEAITQYFNARQKRYKLENGGSDSTNSNTNTSANATASAAANACSQRSKEQIRHFYYRTWHKVAKYVHVPTQKENWTNDKRVSNENNATPASTSQSKSNSSYTINVSSDCTSVLLRDIQVKCLIAYNTLMNKSHRWNKKTALKLVELVNHGWTTVREKGKINRVRMPICKLSSSLSKCLADNESSSKKQNYADSNSNSNNNNNKKENEFAEERHYHANNPSDKNMLISQQSTNFNQTLNIILEPSNESAYCRVRRLAQNPHLNVCVLPNQTLGFFIKFLQEVKWKSRNKQLAEKFSIDQNSKSKQFNNNQDSNQKFEPTSNDSISTIEKIVLYLHDDHLNEIYDKSFENSAKNYHSNNNNQQQQQNELSMNASNSKEEEEEKPQNNNSTDNENNNNNKSELLLIDAIVFDDECAIIPDSSYNINLRNNKAVTKYENMNRNNSNYYYDKFKSGFNLNSTKIRPLNNSATIKTTNKVEVENEEETELTFQHLIDLLPNTASALKCIRLKYDWLVVSNNNNNNFNEINSNSFSLLHTKQQRFYINTLVSVASSFLNDLQKPSVTYAAAANNTNNLNMFKTPQIPQAQQQNSTTKFHNNSSPNTTITTTTTTTTNSTSKSSSVAILQPTQSHNHATILPLDDVLKKLSQEQANKTKKLLSDLSSRARRQRQRKPILIVNNAQQQHYQRPMLLPKIILNNEATIRQPSDNNNLNNNNNNIVRRSGPVAAVARQIVNVNDSSSNHHFQQTTNSIQNASAFPPPPRRIFLTPIQENNAQSQQQQQQQQELGQSHTEQASFSSVSNSSSSKIFLPASFQQAYSNLLPQILSNFIATSQTGNMDSNSNDNTDANDNLNQNLNNSDNCCLPIGNINIGSPTASATTTGLTDLSLLELSLNNADSLLAPPPNQLTTENRNVVVIGSGGENCDSNFSASAGKLIRNFTSFLNENSISLSGILSSLYVHKQQYTATESGSNNHDSPPLSSSSTPPQQTIAIIENNELQQEQQHHHHQNQSHHDVTVGVFVEPGTSATTTTTTILDLNNQYYDMASNSSLISSINNNNNNNNNNCNNNSKLNSNNNRPDLAVEWTDSMNDVSLTGYLFTDENDLQTPVKKSPKQPASNNNLDHLNNHNNQCTNTTNKSLVLSENSRDSVFYNMETIMDILPSN